MFDTNCGKEYLILGGGKGSEGKIQIVDGNTLFWVKRYLTKGEGGVLCRLRMGIPHFVKNTLLLF